MYQPYVDADYYNNIFRGVLIPTEDIDKALDEANRNIDSLTYNRMVRCGIDRLTEFQQGVVKDVCCKLADFEYSNADTLNTALASYSLNGVSMSFDKSWNVQLISGVAIPQKLYAELCQSGLCTGLLR